LLGLAAVNDVSAGLSKSGSLNTSYPAALLSLLGVVIAFIAATRVHWQLIIAILPV
jgi:hypothetical protein